MNDNNLVVLGIDLSQTKKNFDVQLKQICSQISQAQTAKITLSLDTQKTTARFQSQIKSIMNSLKADTTNSFDGIGSSATKAAKPLDGLQNTLKQTAQTAQTTGKTMSSSIGNAGNIMTRSIASTTVRMVAMMTILRVINFAIKTVKQMFNNVVELDLSLTELNKVCEFTGNGLEKFTDKAYKAAESLGRTGKELIDATTQFKKAGYELDASLELGKTALVMTNIGDGIDNVKEASSSLISVLRGFDMDDADALKVVDKINEVANNSPIDFENITEGLKRVSGTLAQTGTSIDETIALITGGFSTLRNVEMVSSGLVMISQRLRGIDEDGQAIEGLAPKIAEDFKSIANIDIEDGNGGLRSTYAILKDMAAVFPTLTDKQRQYLGELAAGNRNVKVLNAILGQWGDVSKAIDQSKNSLGSATKENEIYKNSIAGVKKELGSAFENLSQTVIDGDWIKAPLKALTEFVKILTKLADNDVLMTALGIWAIPKAFNGMKGILSFGKDYTAMIKMIVHGNEAVAQSNAKVGNSSGESCNRDFKINTPTYLKAA
ncbi:MAG: phage tail tape measure protein [Clostridia bacterium]